MSEQNWNDDGQAEINSPEFGEEAKPIKKQKAISNARQALQIAQKLAYNDINRDVRRARVLAAYNGASPYSDEELIQKGQGYRYNVSFGYMEGVIGRAMVPFNDLTIDVSDLTEIVADLKDEKKIKVVQEEFANTMDKWGGWPNFIERLNEDLILNGYNCVINPSPYYPFPIFVQQKEGFVDEGVGNNVKDLELFVWRKSYMLHELYAKIEDGKSAGKAGWNVKNVKDALSTAVPESIWNKYKTTSGQWTAVEESIREGSLYTSIVGAKMVDTYHVFAAEITGKVTHFVVLDDGKKVSDDATVDELEGTELFKFEEQFENMEEFLIYFSMETGQGKWHGSKGVGQRVFNTHKANDKMMNAGLDTVFTAGQTIIQPGDQEQQEELTLVTMGPFTVLPNGVQISPQPLPNVGTTFFQMQALLSGTSENRVGDVVPQSQSILAQGDQTATEAKIKAGRQDLITKGNLKRYIDPVSKVLSMILKRLLIKGSTDAYAKDFQSACKAKGLTDDDLQKIRGARNTGKIQDVLGNTAQATQVIFAEFRNDPSIDQEALKFKRISSVLDVDAAEELIIKDVDHTKQIEAERQQELELTTIMTGKQVPVSPRDAHVFHLEFLLKDIGTKVQAQAQNFNPDEIPTLKLETQHAGEHLKFLMNDKAQKQIAKKLQDRINAANEGIETLEKQQIQMAQAAADYAAQTAKTPEEMAQVQQLQQQIDQKAQQ